MVTLTLLTPFGQASTPHRLMQEFFKIRNLTGPTCVQPQLYAGISTSDGANLGKLTPITLRTEVYTPVSMDNPTAVTWLSNHSALDTPIQLQVPAGTKIDVAVFGVFYQPQIGADGMTCSDLVDTPLDSFSLMGHTSALLQESGSVALPIWVVNADGTSTTYPVSGNPGDFHCPDPSLDHSQCSFKDFVKVSISGSFSSKSLEYPDDGSALHPVQKLRSSLFTFTAPSVFPYHFYYDYSGPHNAAVTTSGVSVPLASGSITITQLSE